MNVSLSGFLNALRQHQLVDGAQVDRFELAYHGRGDDPRFLANEMINLGLLTAYQASVILDGQAAELNLDKHVVLDLLGEGGMGRVYKARHRRLKRLDAIKIIRSDRLVSKSIVDRFFQEAEVMNKLNHPNIVKVFDAGQEGERYFIVMEFIDGVDLGQVITRNGPLSTGQACACMRQAALGLQHAHEKGLVHRDIKPSNLLLARNVSAAERLKILDLGLARLRESESPVGGLTQQGQMMGTPDYMAPEQAEDSHSVDIRADIYSLGCSLYQMLSGEVPFPGGTLLDKLTKHSKAMPPRLKSVPDGLWNVLEKMMAKSRESRHADPAKVAVALASYCDAEVQPPAPAKPADASPRLSGMSILPRTLDLPRSIGRRLLDETGPPESIRTEPPEPEPIRPAPRPAEARSPSPTYLMPDSALWSLPPSAQEDPTHPPVAPPARKPSRRLWILVLCTALIGGGISAALLWPREKDPPDPNPFVQRQPDPSKDHKATEPGKDVKKTKDSGLPPKDQGKDVRKTDKDRATTKDKGIKKTEEPVRPPERKGPGEGKPAGSGMGPFVAGKSAQNRAVDPAEARTGDQDRLDLWATLPAKVQQVVFSVDGTQAAARAGTTIAPFDLKARTSLEKLLPLRLAEGVGLTGQQPLGPIALSPEGRHLIFATLNTTARKVRGAVMGLAEYDTLVRVEDGKVAFYYGDPGLVVGDATQLQTRCLGYSPDGKYLIAGWPMKVVRWDMTLQGPFQDRFNEVKFGGDKTCIAFAPDSKRFVLGCGDGKLYLFPAALDGDEAPAVLEGPVTAIRAATFVGKDQLVSGDETGRLCVWKLPAGTKGETSAPQEKRDNWHTKEITSITATADLFATGGADGKVHLGRVDLKGPVTTFDVGDGVRALAFAAGGKELLVATEKKLGAILLEPQEVTRSKPLLPALTQPGSPRP